MNVKGQRRGVILPSILLLVLIFMILGGALMSYGTSSLRVATYGQQSDQALYAAEAGLAEAAEVYLRTGELPDGFEGTLSGTLARYEVTCTENTGTGMKDVPGGPQIPPGTIHFLARGTSENKTTRKTGALFHLGLRPFQVGALADVMDIAKANFDAYNSVKMGSDPDAPIGPDALEGEAAILASNSNDGTVFSFTDAEVKGNVYVGPNGDPDNLIQESGNVTINNKDTLRKQIDVPPIELPESDGPEIPTLGTFQFLGDNNGVWSLGEAGPGGVGFSINTGAVNTNNFSHIDLAPGSSKVHGSEIMAGVSVTYFQVYTGPTNWVKIFEDGTMFFQSGGGGGVVEGQSPDLAAAVFGGAGGGGGGFAFLGNATNPDTLVPGRYGTVNINSGHPTTLDLKSDREYVFENLIVEGNGKLILPPGVSNVKIYVTGILRLDGENALINETRRAPHLNVYYTGTNDIQLAGGSRAYFTLKAPGANVRLSGPEGLRTEFHGALMGKSVTVQNANFHYDTATAGIGTGTAGTGIEHIHRHRL